MDGSERDSDFVASPLAKWRSDFSRSFQHYLDRSAPHFGRRWLVTLLAAVIYVSRVYYSQGYYVVSYGLATYILNLLIGFLSPNVDPGLDAFGSLSLSKRRSHEFKPFVRRLPEFKFWYAATKAVVVALIITLFSFLDVPVFWPILLFYWLFLFILTTKRQILHMIRYRYIPFNFGKQGNEKSKSSNASSGKGKVA